MITYSATPKRGYEKTIKLGDNNKLLCYSAREFAKRNLPKTAELVGETIRYNKKEGVAELKVNEEIYKVSSFGGHNKLLYKRAGYVCVGEERYIALLKSRVPLLIALLLALCLLVAGVTAGVDYYYNHYIPVVEPYNPLPDTDPYVEPVTGNDTPEAEEDNEGGGSVSLIYSLEAELSLSTGEIDILFQNPSSSNHDVVLDFYVVSGETETLIAESGRIPAGSGLSQLAMQEDSAVLSEGLYQAKFRVIFYNPTTGERALVESDITDVTLTVTP